jgi:hypothetical protein
MGVRHVGKFCVLKVWCGVDYRQLNQKTKKDAYALPQIEEILDCLAGNRYFSVIDMKSG